MKAATFVVPEVNWMLHGVVSLPNSSRDVQFISAFRVSMNLLPLSLKVADGEVFWILQLLDEKNAKEKKAYFAVSKPYRYSGEVVHSNINEAIKGMHGIWKGRICSLDEVRDESDVLNELELDSFTIGECSADEVIISDNFYRSFCEGIS